MNLAAAAAAYATARLRAEGADAPPIETLYQDGLAVAVGDALDGGAEPLPLGEAYAGALAGGVDLDDETGAVRVRRGADRGRRRQRGTWLTPPDLVSAILDRVMTPALDAAEAGDRLGELRICDPACGAGHFLAAAARRLGDRLGRAPEAWQIVGVDLDPVAVRLCRAAIDSPASIAVADGLVDPDLLRDGDFDLVVGNPPYRAGRHSNLKHLRKHFRSAEYQPDPYVLFLERGVRLLRPGGRLALVVPNPWLSNHRTRAIREVLTVEHGLCEVIEVDADAFNAVVETVVPHVVAAGETPARVPVVSPGGSTRGTIIRDPDHPGDPLPLARTTADVRLLEASRTWRTALGDVCEITRGINPYHHTRHSPEEIACRIHHADRRRGPGWYPELRGAHLPAPFRVEWPGDTWIHYGPWLKEPRKPRFFDGPRLVVRKILGETLHAAWLDGPFYADQSVYIARIPPDCPWDGHALLACVNSWLVARLLRVRHQEDDQHFPQLKVAELKSLPLPPVAAGDPRVTALGDAVRRGALDRLEAAVEALYGWRGGPAA